MNSALMPAPSLALPPLPSAAWLRNAGAAVVAVGLHGLVLGLLLFHWPDTTPEPPQVRTLTTRLISLAPPAPPAPPQPEVVVPPAPPLPEQLVKPVEAPKPDPRLQQQKLELEQAALARKRVEEQKRTEQRQEQQRIEQQRLEQQRREVEAQVQQQQQRLAEQQAQAAERARQAEAAAASRQYLPIAKDAPDYPERALDKGIQGDCTVSYRVNPQGRVESPQVVGDCHPLFVRPSLTAAKTFRYQPRIVDGQAVAVEGVKNTFHYRIE
ncbi:energy transducer TonB [Pseudomonas sp. J452]|uniref:energy transducer TonB n=1 Tax=Pseudomonas sp. J452 TaxID=2898441 RepID=UPI0021AD6A38|nr:energy transducer TonB [Pseudomonas sp. J452]UUY09045.1 energy transducer TonB [Pseudomonas sp. J452]